MAHKFTYENTYPDQLPVKIEFNIPSDADLNDMCQEFTNYLKAVGFHIPEGEYLDFVPEEGYTDKGWDDFFDKKNSVTEDFEPKDEPFKPFAYSINSATPQEWNNAYQNVTVKYKEHD